MEWRNLFVQSLVARILMMICLQFKMFTIISMIDTINFTSQFAKPARRSICPRLLKLNTTKSMGIAMGLLFPFTYSLSRTFRMPIFGEEDLGDRKIIKIFVQHATTEIGEEIALTLANIEKDVFGHAGKLTLSKETTGIVDDGNTQAELTYPVKDIGPRLVVHAASTTNFTATSVVPRQGLTAESDTVVAAGEIHLQITGGTENTANDLVVELKLMSKEVKYSELTDVASGRSRNNLEVGAVLPETLCRVERNGVGWLYSVGGTQFDHGYNHLYFLMNTDKLLIVEKKATNARDLVSVLNKETTRMVGDGFTLEAVNKGVAQIQNPNEAAEQVYSKEKLNERMVMLPVDVAQMEAGAHTETVLKEMKLGLEDALYATKVLSSDNPLYGYNAANGLHRDLVTSEIVGLTKEKSQASALCATSGQ